MAIGLACRWSEWVRRRWCVARKAGHSPGLPCCVLMLTTLRAVILSKAKDLENVHTSDGARSFRPPSPAILSLAPWGNQAFMTESPRHPNRMKICGILRCAQDDSRGGATRRAALRTSKQDSYATATHTFPPSWLRNIASTTSVTCVASANEETTSGFGEEAPARTHP